MLAAGVTLHASICLIGTKLRCDCAPPASWDAKICHCTTAAGSVQHRSRWSGQPTKHLARLAAHGREVCSWMTAVVPWWQRLRQDWRQQHPRRVLIRVCHHQRKQSARTRAGLAASHRCILHLAVTVQTNVEMHIHSFYCQRFRPLASLPCAGFPRLRYTALHAGDAADQQAKHPQVHEQCTQVLVHQIYSTQVAILSVLCCCCDI